MLSKMRRVLLVDDHRDTAEVLAMLLTDQGHEVVIAHEGESALVLASQFQPEVAILDIDLPGMDGYQLAARLRSTPQTANCRLLALSGYCCASDRDRSRLAGFAEHLAKPLDLQFLYRAIVAPDDHITTIVA